MYIIETESGKKIEVEIERVIDKDFEVIEHMKRFDFDWNELKAEIVYKLVPLGTNDMAGLMALIDHPEPGFGFTEVKLIESARENVGKKKKFDRIVGTLLAFACQEAFKNGYSGTVFLIPKTGLISLYEEKYGFRHIGRGLCLDFNPSRKLISDFL